MNAVATMLAFLLAILAVQPASASPSDACLAAADRAAARHGVPVGMLRAIALAESGRTRAGRFAPWPWTLNVAGEGRWFETRADALAAAKAVLAGGQRSFDLGCFQINHRWHGDAFASLDDMLDPEAGADYAARFLDRLQAETGDWLTAAGHYHSRTPAFATRYRGRVEQLLARATAMAPSAPAVFPPTARAAPRVPAVLPATIAQQAGSGAAQAPGRSVPFGGVALAFAPPGRTERSIGGGPAVFLAPRGGGEPAATPSGRSAGSLFHAASGAGGPVLVRPAGRALLGNGS